MSQPAYDIGNVLYLRESAALGFLEQVSISGIHKTDNGWVYSVSAGISMPIHPTVYGDRISHVHGQTLYYSEDEFVTHCDALELMEAQATAKLAQIRSMREASCPTDTTDG